MTITLEMYRREYAAEGIGELLYTLISDVVRAVTPSYPPSVYGPGQVWDEDAFDELCQEFTLRRLLEDGVLEHYLLVAEDSEGLRRALGVVLRRFLIGQRQRTEYSNLFKRVRTLLAHETWRFQRCGPEHPVAATIWGLAGWSEQPLVERLDEIFSAMAKVTLPPLIIYRSDSARLSHRVSSDDLGRLLEETFTTLSRWVRLASLMEALRYRLHLVEADVASLDALVDAQERGGQRGMLLGASLEPPDVIVPLRSVAEELFDRLSNRQRQILLLSLTPPEIKPEEIGPQLNIGKSTVYNELTAIKQVIRSAELSSDDATRVLDYLMELCERAAQLADTTSPNSWP